MATPSRVHRKTAARTRTPRRVSPIPPLVTRQRADLFARADQYAAEILRATVTNAAPPSEATDDALVALMRLSPHYTRHCEEIEHVQTLDLTNACMDAGLMLGLAFGLRLRGAP